MLSYFQFIYQHGLYCSGETISPLSSSGFGENSIGRVTPNRSYSTQSEFSQVDSIDKMKDVATINLVLTSITKQHILSYVNIEVDTI